MPRATSFCPRLWLMTDERLGGAFRRIGSASTRQRASSFATTAWRRTERRALFEQVRGHRRATIAAARRRGRQAAEWGADGSHGRGPGAGLRSAPVHSYAEIRAAERNGAGLLFLSPAFPTRSHPGAPALGLARFAWLARRTRLPVIALGGMDERRGNRLASFGAYGWAAIDAWSNASA